jgi:uncharacterized protein YcbK (DUF882 family)
MHVTKNFIFREFLVSSEHPDLAKKIKLTKLDKFKIFILCATILQIVRTFFGAVKILSAKRSYDLNIAVGGADNSDHLFNLVSAAVDFTLSNGELEACFNWIQKNLTYAYGQLIYYPAKNFIHVSLPTPKHKHEAWICLPGKGMVRANG